MGNSFAMDDVHKNFYGDITVPYIPTAGYGISLAIYQAVYFVMYEMTVGTEEVTRHFKYE